MPKVGKNIYKRKVDNRWEGRIKTGRSLGRTHYISVYGRSYAEVCSKMDQVRVTMANKSTPIEKKEDLLLSDAGTNWIESNKDLRKESSIVKYEDMLRNYVIPTLGQKYISDISTEDIEDLITQLKLHGGKKHQGLSLSTLAQVLSVLSSIRKYALRNHYVVGYTTETIVIKKNKNEIRVFNSKEVDKLVSYLTPIVEAPSNIDSSNALTALGVLLALSTGIREGEVCAMKWDNINLQEKTMKVTETLKRIRGRGAKRGEPKTKIVITEPKSENSKRSIPLPDTIIELLKPHYKKGAFILTGDAEKFVEPRTLQYRFKSILKNCGIDDANFHALRHTYATTYVEHNSDYKALAELLGHASVTTTMDKYVHPTRESKARGMEVLAGIIFSVRTRHKEKTNRQKPCCRQ